MESGGCQCHSLDPNNNPDFISKKKGHSETGVKQPVGEEDVKALSGFVPRSQDVEEDSDDTVEVLGGTEVELEEEDNLLYFATENVTPKDLLNCGGRAKTTLNDQEVALICHENVVYAVQEKCPHYGGPLHLGDIEDVPGSGPCIKCPWHSWTFSLQTGRCVAPIGRGPQFSVTTFPVRLNLDRNEIRLGFSEISPKLFSLPPK